MTYIVITSSNKKTKTKKQINKKKTRKDFSAPLKALKEFGYARPSHALVRLQ